MKSNVLMTALVITLLMGVRGFASPCEPVCDPCGACDGCVQSCDLFSGLKKLVNGTRLNDCGPCDGVVACNPCDDVESCNPCDDMSCADDCMPKVALGKRLRNLFAGQACDPCGTGCEPECDPCATVCDTDCDPCAEIGCEEVCAAPRFSLRNLFKGSRAAGCETDCNPCDVIGDCDPCAAPIDCDPCGNVCDTECNPCDDLCNPCDVGCDDFCGPRGHLFDLPRFSLKKFFGRTASCDDAACNPCDEVQCNPCDDTCIR